MLRALSWLISMREGLPCVDAGIISIAFGLISIALGLISIAVGLISIETALISKNHDLISILDMLVLLQRLRTNEIDRNQY